jgi:hypothetical protein
MKLGEQGGLWGGHVTMGTTQALMQYEILLLEQRELDPIVLESGMQESYNLSVRNSPIQFDPRHTGR